MHLTVQVMIAEYDQIELVQDLPCIQRGGQHRGRSDGKSECREDRAAE